MKEQMSHARKRWIAVIASFLLAGLPARYLVQKISTLDGGPGISVFASPNLGSALLMIALVLILALLAGVISARFCGPRVGLFSMGLPLVWSSLGMGRMDDIVRAVHAADGSQSALMWTLAVESIILGAVVFAGTLLIRKASPGWTRRDVSSPFNSLFWAGMGACFLVSALITWLIARSDLPGQVMAACWIGGIVGSAAGRLAFPRVSTLAFVAGIILLGFLAHIGGAFFDEADALVRTNANALFPLNRPLPLVYIAAALVAAPAGSAWGISLAGQFGTNKVHSEDAAAG